MGSFFRIFIKTEEIWIDMSTKLPEIHAKGFEILEKFCRTNGSFCQSPDSRRVTVTIKYPPGYIASFLLCVHKKVVKSLH